MCYFGKGVWDVPPSSPVGGVVGGAESVGVTMMEPNKGCAGIHCVCACLKLSQLIVFLILTGLTIKSHCSL